MYKNRGKKIIERISNSHPRSLKAWKHSLISLLSKFGGIAINLALIPLIISYIGKEEYGVWVIIVGIVSWFSFLDIGIGNGLRNSLAEALALKDFVKAKKLISTAYATIIPIFLGIGTIILLVNPKIMWVSVFNAPLYLKEELSLVMFAVILLFSFQFIFKLVGSILFALQLPAWNNIIVPIGNLMTLIVLLLMINNDVIINDDYKLLLIAGVYNFFPLLCYIMATTVLFFFSSHKTIRPSIKFVDYTFLKEIMGRGGLFLLIQLSAIVMQSTIGFMIAQLYSPSDVTLYDIAFRYLNFSRMLFIIIMIPYWSAVTEAFIKNDLKWINKSYNELFILAIAFSVGTILLIIPSEWVYTLWIGNGINIPIEITIAVAFFVTVFIMTEIPIQFLNGIGKIKLQGAISIFIVLLNIPLSLFLNNMIGIIGIIIAPTICRIIKYIFALIQYKKLLNKSAVGIWNY